MKKLSKEEQAQIDAWRGMWEAGKAAGCPVDQMANFTKANLFLQPKQLQFAAACRECDAIDGPTAIMAGGGRGSSKTHGLLCQIFADDCQRFPGLKVLALRKIGKANQEQINDYRVKLLHGLKHEFKQQAGIVEFENGSKVLLGNFKDEKDIDRYLGQEYDIIYIMESNQLTFSKKKFILTCLRTSKPGWRPRLYEDTNPGGVGMAENKQMYVIPWKQGTQNETRYIHSTVHDNKFVDPGYVKQLQTLTGWQRKAWYEGDWDFLAGSFFTNFIPTYHVFPNQSISVVDSQMVRWFTAYDYGFAHNAAIILFGEDRHGNVYVIDEYCECEETIPEQADSYRSLLFRHQITADDLAFAVAGRDCFSRNEQGKTIAQQFEECGIYMTEADVDRPNGWKKCHSMFGDVSVNVPSKCFIHSRCTHLITQIQLAQHSEKKPGDVEKFNCDAEGNGGDDALDAFRFGIFSDPNRACDWAIPISTTKFQPAIIQLEQT